MLPPGAHEASPSPDDEDFEAAPLSIPPLSMGERPAHRLTGTRLSSRPPPAERKVLEAVTELLLVAGHVNGELCRRERRAVRRILGRLCGREEPPSWLEDKLEHFDPASFDAVRVTNLLCGLHPEERRHVLELVREVCDADNAFDLEEERYLVGLVLALALEPSAASDLVVHEARGYAAWRKRAFNVVFSTLFLATTWPLFIAIGALVRLESPGPALFRQARYGKDGKVINVLKFRTMSVMEDGDDVKQATRCDPRITRLGAFLRRTSLDELPQFVNVLRGDMSVVGPRPHAVAHNRHYRKQILEYMLRHKVKPGITGWAQVNGWRGETDTLDKMIGRVSHDLEYIRRQSLRFDIEIVLRTVLGPSARGNAY